MKKIIITLMLATLSISAQAGNYTICSILKNGCDAIVDASTDGITDVPKYLRGQARCIELKMDCNDAVEDILVSLGLEER